VLAVPGEVPWRDRCAAGMLAASPTMRRWTHALDCSARHEPDVSKPWWRTPPFGRFGCGRFSVRSYPAAVSGSRNGCRCGRSVGSDRLREVFAEVAAS